MSEKILRALMQLFAIIARVDETSEIGETIKSSRGREIVKLFLEQELSANLVEEYLLLFDEYLQKIHGLKKGKKGIRKKQSVNSVKVLRICSDINKELTQRQKFIVLVRILEFLRANESVTEQEIEFVNTVGEVFNIQKEEYDALFQFVDLNNAKILD